MHVVAVWVTIVLAHSSRLLVVGDQSQYISPLSSQRTAFSEIDHSNKRANMAEPTCEELRAMWRYSKRQSRAAETTNELPMYRDPFSYNIWETYPIRSQSLGYRDDYTGPARSRSGGVPIFGKVVHKAPASSSRLRNGMPDRMRAFEEVTRLYGTVNRHPPSPRRRLSFRVGGGVSPPSSEVPQAGSFQHLKELIITERARELQEQRRAEEIAARATALKDITNGEGLQNEDDARSHYLNSLQAYQNSKNVNYDFNPAQYVSDVTNLGGTLSRGDQYGREYMLR